MAIPDADPRAKELDAAFQSAMEGPAKPRAQAQTPPQVDHEAPFGREEDGKPKAPYGYRNDGTIRRAAGGRPSKSAPDAPRTGPAQPSAPSGAATSGKVISPSDYTEGLLGAADGTWLLLSTAAKADPRSIPVVGSFLPSGEMLGAQAYLFGQSRGALVTALNEAAKHNARAAALASKLSSGDASWVLTVVSLAGPFVGASLALWRGDERLDVKSMAARNDQELDAVMAAIAEQARQVQEQAMSEAQAADPPMDPVPPGSNGRSHQQPGPLAAMAG